MRNAVHEGERTPGGRGGIGACRGMLPYLGSRQGWAPGIPVSSPASFCVACLRRLPSPRLPLLHAGFSVRLPPLQLAAPLSLQVVRVREVPKLVVPSRQWVQPLQLRPRLVVVQLPAPPVKDKIVVARMRIE